MPDAAVLTPAEMLDRLAHAGLELALHVQSLGMMSSDVEEAGKAANAFAKASRCVRQCLALKDRLGKPAKVPKDHPAIEARKQALRQELQPRALYDSDPSDYESLLNDLEDQIDGESVGEAFLHEPLHVTAIRIARDLKIPQPEWPMPTSATSSPPERSEERGEGRERGDAALPPPRWSSQGPPDRWT